MRRVQFIELHEQRWMPKLLRNTLTDFLHTVFTRYKVYAPAADLISRVMLKTGQRQILDLCSGGAGPLKQLLPELIAKVDEKVTMKLTDKYPNTSAFEHVAKHSSGRISYSPAPIDAKQISNKMQGIRTFFSSFHHFSPTEAEEILQDAVTNKAPICIFECTERKCTRLMMDLLIPISVLLLMPRVKNIGYKQLFFTYIIPVLPLLILFDGLVSNLRSYKVDELLAMTQSINNAEYYWECKNIKSGFNHCNLTYLIGYPK